MTDPRVWSGRNSQEAVRKVHAEADVPGDAPLEAHPDAKVPGANYVEGSSDARYWVGLQGEVVKTGTDTPVPRRSPQFQALHNRYTSAVERVRHHYGTPTVQELFAVPDPHHPDAFFVYDTHQPPTVRWVDPGGDVHDGYRVVDGRACWDEATVAARSRALAEHPGSAVGERATDTGPLR